MMQFRTRQQTIAHCEQLWRLSIGAPFAALGRNFVAPARGEDGTPFIFKINNTPTLATEIAALRHYNGDGAVNLIAVDEARGAMLLERARPGTPLSTLTPARDEEATRIAAELMRQLWKPTAVSHPFPTIAQWGRGFATLRHAHAGGTGALPADLFAHAEGLFADLLTGMDDMVLLHGDLHHENIVTAKRQAWLAIDPQGVLGEPAYEAGALLRNPMHSSQWPQLHLILQRRLDVLTAVLELDRQRLQGWGMAQAILSACWDIEDGHQDVRHWIAIARALM